MYTMTEANVKKVLYPSFDPWSKVMAIHEGIPSRFNLPDGATVVIRRRDEYHPITSDSPAAFGREINAHIAGGWNLARESFKVVDVRQIFYAMLTRKTCKTVLYI